MTDTYGIPSAYEQLATTFTTDAMKVVAREPPIT